MTLRPTTVFCIVSFSLNAYASDMAIVDAVTGNMRPSVTAEVQHNPISNSGNRASQQPVSKFDHTARQKARELKCETQRNPTVEPPVMGTQILVFSCQDGSELQLQCASGLGCKPQ